MLLSTSKSPKARLVLIVLAFAAVALTVLPDAANPAHAAGGALVQKVPHNGFSSASCAIVFGSSVTSGDLLVALFDTYSDPTLTVSSVTDSRSTPFSLAVANTANSYEQAWIYYGVATSSGSDTIDVGYSGIPSSTGDCFGLELSGVNSVESTGTGSGVSSSPATSSVSYSGAYVMAAIVGTASQSPNWTAGSSYTLIDSASGLYADGEYSTSVSSPSTAPFSLSSSSTWNEVSAAFVETVVQPITVSMSNSAAPAALTLTGSTCNLNSTTSSSDGAAHHFLMISGCPFTLSFTNSGSTRDGFSVSSAFSATSSSETASSSGLSLTAYEQVQESFDYGVSGGGSGYSGPALTGTYLGVTGSSIGTLTTFSTGYWLDYSTVWTTTQPLSGSTSSERWEAETGGSTSGTSSAGGTEAITYTHQYHSDLTVNNCNGELASPLSETGDGWWNSGDTISVTCNGAWGRLGGSGTRAISYNWNGGTNTAVLTTSTFTTQNAATASLTLNVNPTTQYFVTLDSGATAALSACNPTIPGDGCWYDSRTTASIVLDSVFDRGSGSGGRLEDWQLDSGSVNEVTTASPITIQVPVISAPHTIYTVTATQYQVTPSAGLTLSNPTIANDTGWYDANSQVTITGEGGAATYVVSSPIWANQVSSYGMQLITNAQAGSINYGSLDLVYTCASCWTRLFVPTASGLSVQTVDEGGVSLGYSTQGFITSFSAMGGGSSAWEVYFGQAGSGTGSAGNGATTGAATTVTSPTTTASGGLFDNSATTSYIEIILVVAIAIAALSVLALKDQGARNIVIKIRNKVASI